MKQIQISIEEIYINLLLVAISHKLNFARLVKEAEEETNDHINERKAYFMPKGYEGLYYAELLARKMGSSLGDVYNLSEARKAEILQGIIQSIEPITDAYECYYEEEDNTVEFRGHISVLDVSDEQKIMNYYAQLLRSVSGFSDIYSYYSITFRKDADTENDDKFCYSISLAGLQDFSSEFVYDSYEVWSGTDGFFTEFIEKVIDEYRVSHAEKENNDEEGTEDKAGIAENDISGLKDTIEVEKPIIESPPIKDEPKVIEELVKCVWDDTRTIELLDQFEGYDQTDSTRYRRIVVKNTLYTRYANKHHPGFNLVIERGRGSDYVGNVTFTEFKKGEAPELSRHINSEIDDNIIEQYIDKDKFYRFSKPFLLRAQNSSNRTGYGWEWDWSGGYGDYTEGTLYGETTNYFFVGAYVTTGYSYEPKNRKPFVESHDKKTVDKSKSTAEGKIEFYEGKLKYITQNEMVQKYFKIYASSGTKYVPVSYDPITNTFYVAAKTGKKYRTIIENGNYELKDRIID